MRLLPSLLVSVLLAACGSPPETVDRLDCNACHAELYEVHHGGSGFSRDCYECHGTDVWYPANPAHTGFPINAEPHAGYACGDCHPGLDTSVGALGCTSCHAHGEARMRAPHAGVNDYLHQGSACYACHPAGRREGGD